MTKRIFSVVLTVITAATLLTGCGMSKEKEKAETISVYLWSSVLYNTYAPYIQSQLPDVNIQFTVGQNDLDFYKFMDESGNLPDVIMSRRFSRHDAHALKDSLMDLSTTSQAGAVFETYLRDFRNSDGTVNWLPICGVGDGIIANKALFDQHNIPLPTDYKSFVSACNLFEKSGIKGFMADFIYDYTCMEVLQGVSIPEITSMEGSMWRDSYEDPEQEDTGLDKTVWPKVFANMERFIKDTKLNSDILSDTMDCGPIMNMFSEGKVAMVRASSSDAVQLNLDGVETVFLPYFGQDGSQWMLTYPEFQVALNKDLEKDEKRKETALRVLSVILSENAQKTLSQNEDVITYSKNINLELSPYLSNIQPLIDRNHIFIRIASNDFFSISKDVVQKMISGDYDANQAYEAFHRSLIQKKENKNTPILSLKKGCSNVFCKDGGNEAYSAMANSVRSIYKSDVLIAGAVCFTGTVFATDYTEKQVAGMITPNNPFAYNGQISGSELKRLVRCYVEGTKEGFTPFNRGLLPIVSGITIKVGENNGSYTLLEVEKDGKKISDDDTFKVTCLNLTAYMNPILEKENIALEASDRHLRLIWTDYIKQGGNVAEPENYITLKEARR